MRTVVLTARARVAAMRRCLMISCQSRGLLTTERRCLDCGWETQTIADEATATDHQPGPSDPRAAPGPVPGPARRWPLPGLFAGAVADLAALTWVCNGPVTGPINRDERGYSDAMYLSDVHPHVWAGLVFLLVVLAVGGLGLLDRRTRPFSRALLLSAAVGAGVLGCGVGLLVAP